MKTLAKHYSKLKYLWPISMPENAISIAHCTLSQYVLLCTKYVMESGFARFLLCIFLPHYFHSAS